MARYDASLEPGVSPGNNSLCLFGIETLLFSFVKSIYLRQSLFDNLFAVGYC